VGRRKKRRESFRGGEEKKGEKGERGKTTLFREVKKKRTSKLYGGGKKGE